MRKYITKITNNYNGTDNYNGTEYRFEGILFVDKPVTYKEVLGLLRDSEQNNMVIKKVIFNDPATIVIWADGTKTIVKSDNEQYDPEKGLAMAISKKALGNKGNYYKTFKKWLPNTTENTQSDDSNEISDLNFALKRLGDIANKSSERFTKAFEKFTKEVEKHA